MRILIDGMGGDYAPDEIVKGAIRAAHNTDETIVIIGDENAINLSLKKNLWNGNNIEVVNATEVIGNDEAPAMAIKKKKDSSIVKGLNMLKNGEVDVFLSGGSTGALLSGGLLILGRLNGIKRPAIAAWVPNVGSDDTTLLLDCGANADSKPEYLYQNGVMGSIFVKLVRDIRKPIVRLLNVGAEDEKGDELHKEAFNMLRDSNLNFAGNIEGRDIVFGGCDVVVTDGFAGNIFIKATEGMALAIMKEFKNKLTEGVAAKAGALLAYSKIKEIKKEFDYSDAGAAPILGVKKPLLKFHGNSKSPEVFHAIMKAIPYVKNDVTGTIAKEFESIKENEE